jgi:GntR family transcriptional regulator/MocR family aminotransferase
MDLHLSIEGRKDLSGQLYRQLGSAIRSGRLTDGQQLPPSRLLAQQLGISRKPVAEAYSRLRFETLLIGHTGRGTFVSAPKKAPSRPLGSAALSSRDTLNKWSTLAMPFRQQHASTQVDFDFAGGRPTPHHFPQEEWRRCLLHALRRDSASRGRYAAPQGVVALREAIARHAAFSRGVLSNAESIVVTSGAQQALDLLGRILLEPGSCVAVEDPGYPVARLQFLCQGAEVVGVPVDKEGIVVERIPPEARLIYVTPAHQFPLGMPMSTRRKQMLLARALEIGAIIVEDDYDSEFRYEGRPSDSLQSMDKHGIVAFVGTLSKIMLPELRLAYIAAPPALLPALCNAKQLADCHSPTMTQYALAKFIDDGDLLRHIRKSQAVYAGRRAELQRCFAGMLAPWFELVPAVAGFHVAALAVKPLDVEWLVRLARRAGVGLYSLDEFYTGSVRRPGLLFGYGAIDTLDIAPALERVRAILLQMDPPA